MIALFPLQHVWQKHVIAKVKRQSFFKNILWIRFGIFVFFFSLYLSSGIDLIQTERNRSSGRHDNDMYFQADSRYATSALTDREIQHRRILLHPLFIIICNPFGYALNQWLDHKELTATVYCSLVGAAGVLAACYFFIVIGVEKFRAIIYAIILGFSASQYIFSIVPDTYIFSSLGIMCLLLIAEKKGSLGKWITISTYLTGITISNISLACSAAFFYLFGGRFHHVLTHSKRVLQYIGGIILSMLILSLIQKLIYQKWIFQFIRRVVKEQQFFYLAESFLEVWERLTHLLLHLFVFNLLAPTPSLVKHPVFASIELVSFQKASLIAYPLAGEIACLLWLLLVGLAFWSFFKNRLYHQPLGKTLLACLCFQAVLHFFYGEDLMLYTCHWTFLVLVFVFGSLEKIMIRPSWNVLYTLILIFFALFLGANNVQVVGKMRFIFS